MEIFRWLARIIPREGNREIKKSTDANQWDAVPLKHVRVQTHWSKGRAPGNIGPRSFQQKTNGGIYFHQLQPVVRCCAGITADNLLCAWRKWTSHDVIAVVA